MDIEIAILIAGVLTMVGGIIAGGAIYAGLARALIPFLKKTNMY